MTPAERLAAVPRWAWLAGLVLLALLLRSLGVADQPLLPDDYSVGLTARFYTTAGWPEPTMWNHPRLRDLLVAGSQALLGDGPWGIRAWSVLLGTLSVPATAWLVVELGGTGRAALLAGLLVAVDPLHLDFSRQGINDVHLALFPVAAAAAALRHRATGAPRWLALAGLLLGLGLASKWSALLPLAPLGALLGVDLARAGGGRRAAAAGWTFLVAALVALPAAVYLATWLPWLERGYSLAEWGRLQLDMGRETTTHTGYAGTKLPGYAGELVQPWRWYVGPVWYSDVLAAEGAAPAIQQVGVGNPLAWLLVLPGAGLAAWRWRRGGHRASGLALLLFGAAYLPLAVVTRPIWTNTALAPLPFAMALVALAADHLAATRPRLVAGWCVLACALALALAPPACGARTGPTDALVKALLPSDALLPRHGAGP